MCAMRITKNVPNFQEESQTSSRFCGNVGDEPKQPNDSIRIRGVNGKILYASRCKSAIKLNKRYKVCDAAILKLLNKFFC